MNYLNILNKKGYGSLDDLIYKNNGRFKNDEYTVYCLETDEIYNFKILKSYIKYEFRNGAGNSDREEIHGKYQGHYTGGNFIEVLTSDADPLDSTISENSPLGEKLIKSQKKDILTINVNKKVIQYIVLNIPNGN